MKKIVLVGILTAAGLFANTVQADDMAKLKEEIQEQYKTILKMQMQLEKLEANQKKQGIAIQSAKENQTISLGKAESLKLHGDFRYRHEIIDAQNSDESNKKGRNRQRIRARVGMTYKINENTDFDLRIASGSEDPVSSNQSLDGYFTSKSIWLDRAYLTWRPNQNLSILAGKMGNPFYKAVKNQLIWDGDLNPEGIAAKYKFTLDECTDGFINGGGFWVEEESSNVDQALWGIQAGLKRKYNESYILAGASYYDYSNVEGSEAFFESKGEKLGFGNTLEDGRYVNDYDLFEAFGEYGTKIGKMPVTAYGSYVKNLGANTSEDTAWLVGCKINKAKKAGSWEFGYDYRDVEKDGVFGVFTDSDFGGGGTDAKGHRVGLKYQLTKNVQMGLNHFYNQRTDDDLDYNRTQIDFIVKF